MKAVKKSDHRERFQYVSRGSADWERFQYVSRGSANWERRLAADQRVRFQYVSRGSADWERRLAADQRERFQYVSRGSADWERRLRGRTTRPRTSGATRFSTFSKLLEASAFP